MTGQGATVDKASRNRTAKALLAYWQSFSNRLPRLPPAELEWITKELSAGIERFNAVSSRREFAFYKLAQTADNCIDIYSSLLQSDEATPSYEVRLWVKSLNCYIHGSDTLVHLQTAGLSNGKYDGSFNIMFSGLWMDYTIDTVIEAIP
jgi:hypothetical protein